MFEAGPYKKDAKVYGVKVIRPPPRISKVHYIGGGGRVVRSGWSLTLVASGRPLASVEASRYSGKSFMSPTGVLLPSWFGDSWASVAVKLFSPMGSVALLIELSPQCC